MNNRVLSFLLVIASFGVVSSVVADGSHGVKIKITNNINEQIEIQSFNGLTCSGGVPHKVYYVDSGGTRTAKCHGQGKDRCYISIHVTGETGEIDAKCVSDDENCTVDDAEYTASDYDSVSNSIKYDFNCS